MDEKQAEKRAAYGFHYRDAEEDAKFLKHLHEGAAVVASRVEVLPFAEGQVLLEQELRSLVDANPLHDERRHDPDFVEIRRRYVEETLRAQIQVLLENGGAAAVVDEMHARWDRELKAGRFECGQSSRLSILDPERQRP